MATDSMVLLFCQLMEADSVTPFGLSKKFRSVQKTNSEIGSDPVYDVIMSTQPVSDHLGITDQCPL